MLALGLLVYLSAAIVACAPASAEFSTAALLSGTRQLQFDEANSPAFSQNGEYVVFRGSLAGVPGIYRRDLASGEIAPVAIEDAGDTAISAPDAAAPSISADGRYIAFTSTADLDPTEEPSVDKGCPEVYIRDMSIAFTELEEHPERAYTLASAVNRSSEGLTYAAQCPARSSTELAVAGAQAAAGVALSADGSKVVFTVLNPSNLEGSCSNTLPLACSTEAGQVAVRDLDTQTTTLVSATPQGQPTPGGGAFPSSVSEQRLSQGGIAIESNEPVASSAAISADGSTVAWQGTNVPAQVPSANDVETGMAPWGGAAAEVEPLWRRIADGPTATTRRLLNEAGLNFYFAQSHENSQTVEGGALAPVSRAFIPPVLSADGGTVAAIANSPTAANEPTYRFLSFNALPPADAYVIRVDSNPDTLPQVTPLTVTPDFAALRAIFDGVADVAISPDGSRVAFNTRRVSFASASSTLISPPVPEGADAYTYVANLQLGTLQRVTNTYEGAPPTGEPGMLSFSGEGFSLAFASSASNLFYGDVTPNVSQVYLTQEAQSGGQQSDQSTSPALPTLLPIPSWTLSATAAVQKDGSVLVYTELPGDGRLNIDLSSQLPLMAPKKTVKAKSGRRSVTRKSSARRLPTLVTRTIAHAAMIASGASELPIRLRVAATYQPLVAAKKGLYALLHIAFLAPGHATLTQEIPVILHRTVGGKASRRKATPKTGKASRGRATPKAKTSLPRKPRALR